MDFRALKSLDWLVSLSFSFECMQSNLSFTTEAILLAHGNPSLLSQRLRIFESLYRPSHVVHCKKKRKATTGDREERSAVFIATLNRKMERKRQIKEKEKRVRLQKLHRLDQNHRQTRQVRLTQLNRLRSLMAYEEGEWIAQRSALLEDAYIPFPAVDSAVFVILVLRSPSGCYIR